jgi:hypothetical protein
MRMMLRLRRLLMDAAAVATVCFGGANAVMLALWLWGAL